MNKVDRYLDNIELKHLKQLIRSFLKDPKGTKVFVEKQIDEFDKMYPKGSE